MGLGGEGRLNTDGRLITGDLNGLTDAFPLTSDIAAVWKDGEGMGIADLVKEFPGRGVGVSGMNALFIRRRA